ncbi:hypothetical protein FOIG_08560 [Fusarium odoratissimum NRRL 54006]|nr:uncharacterized protein FOIG_08560 [Fusarium odoratissimum NRRL 54006]EXL99520.1 hypothetical protein FOIG_08560 [Fusarium odoratissimum NRRL 54006]
MVLFQFKTRASSLGNAWQATAQVVSTETRAVVEEASAVRDKEVEAWARSSVFPEGRACNDVRCQEQNGDRGSKDVKDIGRFQASGFSCLSRRKLRAYHIGGCISSTP